MGTSRSNGGPGDRTPLLPAWALPGGAPPPPLPPDEPDGDGDGDNSFPDTADTGSDDAGDGDALDNSSSEDHPGASAAPPSGRWQAAKRMLTQSARAGGDRANVSAAGRAYVRAKGGSRAAANAAVQGRTTAAHAARFLGTLASGGLAAALDAIGLRNFIGRNAEVVFAAIANAIAPPGATLEEAAARRAADEVLARLYDERIGEDGDTAPLERMSETDVAEAVRGVISAYVYERWLEELGKSIESGAVSPAEAVKQEREMKLYVRDIVQLDVSNEDVLAFGRDPAHGQAVIQRLFDEAYAFLEDGR